MIGAIIQARMGSTRLPGKVMKEVLGKPLIYYLLERLKYSGLIKKIVVATTDQPGDTVIKEYVESLGIEVFCGSQSDVLDRYHGAAKKYGIDPVIRITSDCPLLDPEIVDAIISFYLDNPGYDLVHTGPSYPEGLDMEIFPFASLDEAWKKADLESEREHVTAYIWKRKADFKIKTMEMEEDLSSLRITVDEEADFNLVKQVFEKIYKPGKIFSLNDVLKLRYSEPGMFNINKNIIRNEGYLKSLKKDKKIER